MNAARCALTPCGGGGAGGGATGGQMPTGGAGGLGNLGLPDSEYLNPILEQRIDYLKRMIARLNPKPVKKVKKAPAPVAAVAEEAVAEEAPAEE